jgi:hypothetical protein
MRKNNNIDDIALSYTKIKTQMCMFVVPFILLFSVISATL